MPEAAARLILWRAYVPRWAHRALSGEGEACFGGRWNAVGTPAIYAARELSTAWAEYNQGFVQHPAIIAQLQLENAALADLTSAETLLRHRINPSIHDCDWRDALDRGEVPETHLLQKMLLAAGYDGVVYPSFMSPGGSCVALCRWNEDDGPALSIVDPEGRLPRSEASWL